MARRARKIPLAHRLPNPSALFVGRERELSWLAEKLERVSVVLVRGPGGLGKTSLVLQALSSAFPKQLKKTLYLKIGADEPADQVRLNLAHLLAECSSGRDSVNIAGMRGDPEELVATALDFAEDGGYWVVIDDLHLSDSQEMGELIRQLAAYARKSRWIVTTRATVSVPQLEGQILDIEPMPNVELAQLARALDERRSPGEVQTAVNASAGSPWLLRQYMGEGMQGIAASRAGVLESLSQAQQAALRTLSLLDIALPEAVLERVRDWPAREELEALHVRGLLATADGGLTVHEHVVEFLFPTEDEQHTERARAALATQLEVQVDQPQAVLEALRLHQLRGDADSMVRLLDEHGHELMGLGYAPRIWVLIGARTDSRLALWQLRCAAELGNSTVLAAVHEPRLTNEQDQLAWAATQYLLGEPEEARRLALVVHSNATSPDVRSQASLLAARGALRLGLLDEALETLGADASLAQRCLRTLVRSHALEDGVALEAAALLRDAPADAEPEALLDLATVFHQQGERKRADDVIHRVLATPRGGRASLLVARQAMLLRARIRLELGEFAEAELLLDVVRPFARGVSILRPLLIELDALRRIAIGDFDGLATSLATGRELAIRADTAIMERVQHLEGRVRALATGDVIDPPSGSAASLDLRRLEDGLATGAGLLPTNLTDAVDGLRAIHREAKRAGLRLCEADALLLLADGLLAALQLDELGSVTRLLEELADAVGSARLRHHAAFYQGYGEASVLERIAAEEDVAPVAARRCRSLLGQDVPVGPLDEIVLAAARTDWSDRSVSTIQAEGTGWRPAWGLDVPRTQVWLPDGRVVDLARKQLAWRILTAIAARGSATKEELILDAWNEHEYHPIRHDPKLHVAIRALRNVLEDDPSQPTRLLTNEDGYRFGGTVRRVSAL